MGTFILLAIVIGAIIYFTRKPKSQETTPPSANTEQPQRGSPEWLIADGEKLFIQHPNLSQTDPTTYRQAKMALARLYAQKLGRMNIPGEVSRNNLNLLTWRDQQIAAIARECAARGRLHGEEFCALVEPDTEMKEEMAFLYCTSALVARLDQDYANAVEYNWTRLRYDIPDNITENTIEGMLSDATRAGGAEKAANLLTRFSQLADQNPVWEQLTPKIRAVVG